MTTRYRSRGDRWITAFVFNCLDNNSRIILSNWGGPPAEVTEALVRIISVLGLTPNGAMARLIPQTTIATPVLARQLDCDEAVLVGEIERGERGGLRLKEGGPWFVHYTKAQ